MTLIIKRIKPEELSHQSAHKCTESRFRQAYKKRMTLKTADTEDATEGDLGYQTSDLFYFIPQGLAAEIGLNQALFLQKLHYWTVKGYESRKNHQPNQIGHFQNGILYIDNSLDAWNEQLPHICRGTLQNVINGLKDRGLILVERSGKPGGVMAYALNLNMGTEADEGGINLCLGDSKIIAGRLMPGDDLNPEPDFIFNRFLGTDGRIFRPYIWEALTFGLEEAVLIGHIRHKIEGAKKLGTYGLKWYRASYEQLHGDLSGAIPIRSLKRYLTRLQRVDSVIQVTTRDNPHDWDRTKSYRIRDEILPGLT